MTPLGKRLTRTVLAGLLLGCFLALPAVARATSSNADLSALSTPAGALSPTFSAATQGYVVTPATHLTSTTVTAVPADAGATMTVTPQGGSATPLTSGVASAPIALATGDNGILITVTASDTVTVKTYNVDVADPSSTDASLAGLSVSNGSLNTAFSPGVTSYSVTTSGSSETLTAALNNSGASATISFDGGTPVALSGPYGPVSLNGLDTFAITVTAEDNSTRLTYNVVVARTPSTLLQASAGGIAAPGSAATASTSGISATLNQASGPSSGTLFVARYSSNPAAGTTAGTSTFYDVRVTGTNTGSQATVTFTAPAGSGILTLEYFNTSTNSYRPVTGSTIVANSLVSNTAANTITVIFDGTSTPALASLTGTVFEAAEAPVPSTGAVSDESQLEGPGVALLLAGILSLVMALRNSSATKRQKTA